MGIDQRPPRRARDKLLAAAAAAAASSAMLPEGFDFSPPTGYRNSGPTSRHPAFPQRSPKSYRNRPIYVRA